MSDIFHHGVRVEEINEGGRPIRTISTAIIGLLATANDADAQAFPLDTPVLVTDLPQAISKAGKSGTLATALMDIYEQANAVTVVVRVAEHDTSSDDGAAQNAAAIGDFVNGRYTGAKALLTAHTKLRVTPRILGAPGLDSEVVTKELVSIAKKMNAFVYARAVGESKEEAVTYRNKFAARELMLLWPDLQGWNHVKGKEGTRSPVAAALGMRAKLDNEVGWHKVLSNVPLNGMTGMSHDVTFSLTETATDADYLNENRITTLVANEGMRFWGDRTTSDDVRYLFESYTRTAQVIKDSILLSSLWAADKRLLPGVVSDIFVSVRAKMRQLTSDGYLFGGDCWFDEKINSKETLSSGKLWIDYDFTPVPPLEQLTYRQHITDRYLLNFDRRISVAA